MRIFARLSILILVCTNCGGQKGVNEGYGFCPEKLTVESFVIYNSYSADTSKKPFVVADEIISTFSTSRTEYVELQRLKSDTTLVDLSSDELSGCPILIHVEDLEWLNSLGEPSTSNLMDYVARFDSILNSDCCKLRDCDSCGVFLVGFNDHW